MEVFASVLTPINILIGVLTAVLPALLWLWFWLREDSVHPEPKRLIVLTFIGGCCATLISLVLESLVPEETFSASDRILIWASIEEITKFALAYVVALSNKNDDEPIDPVMYMITSALGFAALENFLFFINTIAQDGTLLNGAITINVRFIGATLLHTAASAFVGVLMAFTFYDRMRIRIPVIIAGIASASLLHAFFNFYIMKDEGTYTFVIFAAIWFLLIFLLLIIEKIKHITPRILINQ